MRDEPPAWPLEQIAAGRERCDLVIESRARAPSTWLLFASKGNTEVARDAESTAQPEWAAVAEALENPSIHAGQQAHRALALMAEQAPAQALA